MIKKGLLILLCLPMIGFGQNVNIPDANFKSYLVGNTSINTNGDSEIQVSEATATLIFYAIDNPNLSCINVDDVAWSTTNWLDIDFQHYFSNNCFPSAVQQHTTNKELLKVTDLLGRKTKQTNQPLFYIYDDGTVEKRIVIE